MRQEYRAGLSLMGALALTCFACASAEQEPAPRGRPEAIEALASASPLPGDYRLPLLMKDDRVPTARELSVRLGVRIEALPNETNQFVIRGQAGSVKLSTLGTIHLDLGYAVGVTLPNGVQIGFRYLE